MTRKKRRMWVLLLCAIGLGSATALTLTAFQDNLVFFRSPSDIAASHPGPERAFRLGGLVEAGSVKREPPTSGQRPVVLPRLGTFKHEAAAVDPVTGCVYLTEDAPDGRLYRFRPDVTPAFGARPDFENGIYPGFVRCPPNDSRI